jgi:predicted HAD superfamily phosphohydrolase YqeG
VVHFPKKIAQKDIRHLDFRALKEAGYCGAVFDKDNCLVGFVSCFHAITYLGSRRYRTRTS